MNRIERLKYGFILLLAFTVIIFLYFLFNVIGTSVKDNMDVVSWTYYSVASLGHAFLFASLLYICTYVPFAFIFKNYKVARSIFIVFALLLQLILVLDHFVFGLYKFHINGFVFELLFGGAASDIFVFDWMLCLKLIGLILVTAVLPCFLAVFFSKKHYKRLSSCTIKSFCFIAILCIIISHIGYAIAYAAKQSKIQKASTALPLFFPLTANSLLMKLKIITPDDIDNLSYNTLSSDIEYPLHPITINKDSISNYNILCIVIDSWNPTIFDSIVSPNIHSFAQKGQVFTHHLSSNNGTRGSIFGLFFGLSFTYEKEFDICKMSPLIVDRLLDQDYDIELFPSANFTSPPFHEMIFRRVPNIRTRGTGDTPFDRDIDIIKGFVNFIGNRQDNKPFFSFLFYDLPHAMSLPKEHTDSFQPSWTSPDYLSLNNQTDRTPFFNLYKNCVHYTDKLVGEALATLDDKGLLKNTIVIITGDHGQEFNENKKNYWGHGSNYSEWQIKIPLVVYYPGIESGITNTHATTHYDIMPTVLNRFMGVENPTSDYSMGHDLWDTCSRFPHIVGDHINYGFIMNGLILKTGYTGTIEVTDLSLNDMPKESIDKKQLLEVIALKNKFYKN